MNDHKLVFVGGLHRSGTSLLHRAIKEHPEVSGFNDTEAIKDEGQHLQSVFPPAKPYGGPGVFGFNTDSHFTEASELATESNAEKLFRQWSQYWDLDQPVLVEKSPPTLTRSRFLQALFPDACFIIIQRHPVPVSYATQKWSGTRMHQLIRHWLVCHERFESDKEHLQRVHTLRYEQFIDQPQQVMDEVWQFLDLPAVPLQQEMRPDINEKYLERWRMHAKLNWKWKLYAQYIKWRFESRVRQHGYSLYL